MQYAIIMIISSSVTMWSACRSLADRLSLIYAWPMSHMWPLYG